MGIIQFVTMARAPKHENQFIGRGDDKNHMGRRAFRKSKKSVQNKAKHIGTLMPRNYQFFCSRFSFKVRNHHVDASSKG